jgi:CheY-like chemotaxis protein
MVYGFVTQSGGEIELHSTLGAGTTVEIRLPEVLDAPTAIPGGLGQATAHGTETLLVIDDEDAVLQLLRRILTGLGYDVLAARDGPSAIAIARARAAPIDLILSDVIMPGMTGPEAVAVVRMIHPEAAVLFASGYTADAITDRGVLPAGVELIEKPYTTRDLAARIRRVLDQRLAGRRGNPGEPPA